MPWYYTKASNYSTIKGSAEKLEKLWF